MSQGIELEFVIDLLGIDGEHHIGKVRQLGELRGDGGDAAADLLGGRGNFDQKIRLLVDVERDHQIPGRKFQL